ncbi:MAG: AraC family transcriptional regulator [Roseiflexaceae bacterium]|nr:AraC family transcriptional regulator [Roseiflexaceae bacterium]
MAEWSRYDHYPQLAGLERLQARFRSHAFTRHAHDYYVIGIIRHGVQSFEYGQRHYVTPNGAMCIINPGETHTGQAVTEHGFDYQAIYPSAALMEQIASEVHGHSTQLPWFDAAVIVEPDLVAQLQRLHHVLDVPSSLLERETRLIAALTALVSRHTSIRRPAMPVRYERPAVVQIRDYIEEHYGENISLSQIAKVIHLSPWYAARIFQQVYGLPPHAYLEGVRIRHARALLRQGRPLAWIAATTGFVDQSHFTRRFKRHLGSTPGQYAQHHKIVQDGELFS